MTDRVKLNTSSSFLETIVEAESDAAVLDLCRRYVLHGTPFVFADNEDGYYRFRKRIADKFEISFHEIYVIGSAKLGFRMSDGKPFDFDSDIDVAIVAGDLFDRIMRSISEYQMSLREARRSVTERELQMYHQFLEYTAIGWIRPDKLPLSFSVEHLKSDWFDFFRSISSGSSEVGNYAVNGGVFRTYAHLENYQYRTLLQLRRRLLLNTNK
jgi:hypothetical protein